MQSYIRPVREWAALRAIMGSRGTRASAVRAPAPIGRPCSRSRPRITLIRAVRAACHCVRTRCRACRACWSTVFTGTG